MRCPAPHAQADISLIVLCEGQFHPVAEALYKRGRDNVVYCRGGNAACPCQGIIYKALLPEELILVVHAHEGASATFPCMRTDHLCCVFRRPYNLCGRSLHEGLFFRGYAGKDCFTWQGVGNKDDLFALSSGNAPSVIAKSRYVKCQCQWRILK